MTRFSLYPKASDWIFQELWLLECPFLRAFVPQICTGDLLLSATVIGSGPCITQSIQVALPSRYVHSSWGRQTIKRGVQARWEEMWSAERNQTGEGSADTGTEFLREVSVWAGNWGQGRQGPQGRSNPGVFKEPQCRWGEIPGSPERQQDGMGTKHGGRAQVRWITQKCCIWGVQVGSPNQEVFKW